MSADVFLMPDVGEGLTEAEIVHWKVRVGETVSLNQPLVDIETAKATVELPSPFAGVVTQLHGAEGDVIDVGQPLITIDTNVREDSATALSREPLLVGYGVANDVERTTRRKRRVVSAGDVDSEVAKTRNSETTVIRTPPVRTTPPVRLYAKQNGVDLSAVVGTGRGGVVTREDIDRSRTPMVSTRNTSTRFVGHELASWDDGEREERLAVRGVLRSMAQSMVQSVARAPHAAVWVRTDATKTTELVASLKKRTEFSSTRLSPLVIVALAVVDAARNFPGINAVYDDDTDEVIIRRHVNLGIAADTPRGLIVPNIKDADRLNLQQMASALSDLVHKARSGTSTPGDMLGTTITITNVGPFGVDGAVPILPLGTSAILCVGQIAPAPWVLDGNVVVRDVVEIVLSFDHRLIDGALASSVIAHIAGFLADPAPALLALRTT